MPEHFYVMTSHLAAFARQHGAVLDDDGALDLAGHLVSDQMQSVVRDDPSDYHMVIWNREVALTAELFGLAESAEDAVAVAIGQASDEGFEIDDVQRDGDAWVVWTQGQRYAEIERVKYESPDEATVQRFETLVGKISTWDEVALIRALSDLPAWKVTADNRMPLWSKLQLPSDSPRSGEWLPRMSVTHGRGKRGLVKTGDTIKDLKAEIEFENASGEKNRLPMWVTPQSMAKLLQKLVEERGGSEVKLSGCQEALAKALGVGSWQVLLAKFRKRAFVQACLREGAVDARKNVIFYRSPTAMLAGIYGRAREMKSDGKQLHLAISWIGDAPDVRWCDRSVDELRSAVAAEAGPNPDSVSRELRGAAEEAWEEAEVRHRQAAGQWGCYSKEFELVMHPDEASIDAAAGWLASEEHG